MTSAGLVTILFTDLVGSTELLEQLGDEAAESVRRAHFNLLRESVAASGGHEVKSLGDGLMVVFPSALDAISCAVAMQQAIDLHNQEVGAHPLQVRVGLHAGEPIFEEDDYFGTPVVVASRLCNSAQGGQIVISELVRALVGSRRNFTFRELGEIPLKGLATPLAACEVAWQIPAGSGAPALSAQTRVAPSRTRPGAVGVSPRERPRSLRAFAIAGSVVVIGAILGAVLIPASPLSILHTSAASLASSTPTPTATPALPPTATPIPPSTGVYQFGRCGLPPVGDRERARLKLCVESVEVNLDGTMKFNISWQAEIEEGLVVDGRPVNALEKESDIGNTNMYINDDRGNRYDFIDLGGAAREHTIIANGEKAMGWYIFPPAQGYARTFIFIDEDNHWAIPGILLVK